MADEIPGAEAPADTSLDGALDRAFAAIEGRDEPVEDGPTRDASGRFARREGEEDQPAEAEAPPPVEAPPVEAPAPEAAQDWPKGISAAAQQEWTKVPPTVRSEVQRRFSEMEQGIEQYRQRFEPLRRFEEMARQGGTTIDAALHHYTGIEAILRQDPLEGLGRICQNLGLDPRSVAAHVLGQQAPEPQQEVMALRHQLSEMQTRLTHYEAEAQRTQQARQEQAVQTVSQFAEAHPRFNELAPTIKWLLDTGGAGDLEGAYTMAERLNPAPTPAPVADTQAAPQQRKAGLSIAGSPGSNPVVRTPSKSSSEAIDRAFARQGIA
jgi:hypothetical protein